jgi:hypothetical protein
MVEREILSHAQQEKGISAQVYRQALFNKSKVMRMFTVPCQEGT